MTETSARGPVEDYPELYDWTYVGYNQDLPYWKRFADPAGVLELGSGTGRVSIPLASSGVPVVGLDHSPRMLRLLTARCRRSRVTVRPVLASMEALPFDAASFSTVICPFSTINYCTTQASLLTTLREACRVLRPGGTFAFEALAWSTWQGWLCGDETPRLVRASRDGGVRSTMHCVYAFDAAAQLARQVRTYRTRFPDGREQVVKVDWQNRFALPGELRLLIERAGMTLVAEAGDYDGGPYKHGSEFYLAECTRR